MSSSKFLLHRLLCNEFGLRHHSSLTPFHFPGTVTHTNFTAPPPSPGRAPLYCPSFSEPWQFIYLKAWKSVPRLGDVCRDLADYSSTPRLSSTGVPWWNTFSWWSGDPSSNPTEERCLSTGQELLVLIDLWSLFWLRRVNHTNWPILKSCSGPSVWPVRWQCRFKYAGIESYLHSQNGCPRRQK